MQELLPEKRFLYFPLLARVAGSEPLAGRVAALRPDIHLFGHTHFSWDATLHGQSCCFASRGLRAHLLSLLDNVSQRSPHVSSQVSLS